MGEIGLAVMIPRDASRVTGGTNVHRIEGAEESVTTTRYYFNRSCS